MNGAAVIRWGSNVPGREAKGLDAFAESVARFEDMTKQGRLHAHREYFTLTGRDGGFAILEGEVEELMRILGEEETLRLNARAAAIVEDFEIQIYAGGTDQAVQQLTSNYAASMQELGYL